jgi:hypothetical protein
LIKRNNFNPNLSGVESIDVTSGTLKNSKNRDGQCKLQKGKSTPIR